jgi:hypothetical protein
MTITFDRRKKKEVDKLFKRWKKRPDICPECSGKYSKSDWYDKNIDKCPSCEFEPKVTAKLQRIYGDSIYQRTKELEKKRGSDYEIKRLEKKYGKI